MIKVEKESSLITKSVDNEVVDAVEEFMLDENGFINDFSDYLVNSSAFEKRSVMQAFEKFDASFRIDEIAQFQESFHFSAVGLDSSYCTSNVSSVGSNNMSFAQDSLLSLARSLHHKPSLLDTSYSHDDGAVSFSSSSSFFMESKRVNEEVADSKADGHGNAQQQANAAKQVQPHFTISRTCPRQKVGSGVKSDEKSDDKNRLKPRHAKSKSTCDMHDDPMGQSSAKRIEAKKMRASSGSLTSSSHHSQSSRRKPYDSPRRRVVPTNQYSNTESGNASITELSASSHHSQAHRRIPFRSPRRRATRRDLTESGHSSTTDLSSSVHHHQESFESISDGHFRDGNKSSSSLDVNEGISKRRRVKMTRIRSDSFPSSSYHSQSSSRKGLEPPRHRDQGSRRSDLGTFEKNESERKECLKAAETPSAKDLRRSRSRSQPRLKSHSDHPNNYDAPMKGVKARRGRSRSRPRLRPMGAEIVDIKGHRRCHSQPRLRREIVPDATQLQCELSRDESNEHQNSSSCDTEQLDARTAARIERARASREKHLAKIQKEKERARNEKRNLELFDKFAHRSISSYH